MPVSLKIKVPDEWWSEAKVRRELAKTLKKETGKKIQADFKSTTQGWERKNKPKFPIVFRENGREMSVKVATKDTPYVWVSGGTKRRFDIVPVKKPFLAFQSGYTAGTKPGKIASKSPSRSGPWVYTKLVKKKANPGIKARKFDKTIRKRQKPTFYTDVAKALYRGMVD